MTNHDFAYAMKDLLEKKAANQQRGTYCPDKLAGVLTGLIIAAKLLNLDPILVATCQVCIDAAEIEAATDNTTFEKNVLSRAAKKLAENADAFYKTTNDEFELGKIAYYVGMVTQAYSLALAAEDHKLAKELDGKVKSMTIESPLYTGDSVPIPTLN